MAVNPAPLGASEQAPPAGHKEDTTLKRQAPSILSKLSLAGHIYVVKGVLLPFVWLRDWTEYFYPPAGGPNIVKTYECRPSLPVRIFFPKSYDQTSPTTLPTLFTIHGGGFCIGNIRDDDEWNRAFADGQDALVVALNYSKAPACPFPTGLHDIEALLLAIFADESLPIDRRPPAVSGRTRSRTAILGFSAGGNLALSASQLPSIREHALAPAAAVSVYGYLDLSVPSAEKLANRPFKKALYPPRNETKDILESMIPTFDWSYIPYGQDLRDPLLSPYFAPIEKLPPFVGLISAELDLLAHESWRLACRLAREGAAQHDTPTRIRVPDPKSEAPRSRICGRETVSARPGKLEVTDPAGKPDERFAFEENWDGAGVKWLLVPDALHGFDNEHLRNLVGGQETMRDAKAKAKAVLTELGQWLNGKVWK